MVHQMMDLHVHSVYSDGNAHIEDIVRHASRIRLKIIAITDHCSKTYTYVGGRMLNPDVAMERAEVISEVNSRYNNIVVLNGIESDIDGGIVVFPRGLKKDFFDLVIGSIHKSVSAKVWYQWSLSAIRSGNIDVLGHPFSYVRENIPFEMVEEVLIELADHNVAFELNMSYGLPPEDVLLLCKEYDVPVSVGSDAHSLFNVGMVDAGFSVAKKFGLRIIRPQKRY